MSEKIMVIDTETVSIDKKFCYNIGYTIVEIIDSENYSVLENQMVFRVTFIHPATGSPYHHFRHGCPNRRQGGNVQKA